MATESPTRTPTAIADRRRGGTWPAFYLLSYFIVSGLIVWHMDGQVGQLAFLTLIGLFTSSGFVVHAKARPARKNVGRRLSLALVGLSLLLGAGIFGRQSFQIEGLFFYAFAGVFGGVVTHYLVAKIVGPLVVGRAWCGWGCWIWMVFDYLPWKRSPGRRTRLGWLRTAHFTLSLGLVGVLVLVFGYDHGFVWTRTDGLWWFLGGCLVYYGAGLGLAAFLRDNRAFCKYLCPITVFLRAGNRVSLLKVAGGRDACTRCHACDKICPMDVHVSAFVEAGTRVLDPECTMCQSCIAACSSGGLKLTLGLDLSRS